MMPVRATAPSTPTGWSADEPEASELWVAALNAWAARTLWQVRAQEKISGDPRRVDPGFPFDAG